MVRDVRDTWASVVFDDQSSVMDMFTTTKVVVNSDLAKLYGLDTTGLTPTTFQTKSLPADGTRAGLLSKAGLLSEFANQQFGSPTLRGKFMRESLMCLTVPPPPKGVNQGAVDQPTDVPMTRRQRLEQHRKDPTCAGCHALMDPLGLPLESFDAIGKYRTTDNGLPVDPSGAFDGQAVADARGLGAVVSQSATVAQCLVRRYYAYAVGHAERRRRRQRAQRGGDGVQGVRLQDARPDPGGRHQRRLLHRHPATLTVTQWSKRLWIDERFSKACWRQAPR